MASEDYPALQEHMTADPLFRIYVLEALKRPHGEPAE